MHFALTSDRGHGSLYDFCSCLGSLKPSATRKDGREMLCAFKSCLCNNTDSTLLRSEMNVHELHGTNESRIVTDVGIVYFLHLLPQIS